MNWKNKNLFFLLLLAGCTSFSLIDHSPSDLASKSSKVKKRKKLASPPHGNAVSKQSAAIVNYCKKVESKFRKYRWKAADCLDFKWLHVRNSVWGDPLIWAVFGDEEEHKKKRKNMTMVLCGVHGDEITPVKFCFDILHHLKANIHFYRGTLIAVAPIVNPDSFFKRRPSRVNARGVDINRNFPTRDWQRLAQKIWHNRYRSDKRRNPGKKPLSEPEVLFQMNLIRRYKPGRIISVHAPLTLLDYDGPVNKAANGKNRLLIQMSKHAKGYNVKNFPFFPGSLGNWAGHERNIPTYTLELPSSDYTKHKKYWKMFKDALHVAFLHDLSTPVVMKEKKSR